MRFRKIYLEISNLCNLRCAFCPGTRRPGRAMTEEDMALLLPKLRPYAEYLYFHLMGEPLLHPKLEAFLNMAGSAGFKVILTTNGTLLEKRLDTLSQAGALHKINISLHAFEANDLAVPFRDYLDGCFRFGKALEGRKIIAYRLWNNGGQNEKNEEILTALKRYFPDPWVSERRGTRIGERVYLEYGDKFDWPDLNAEDGGDSLFCYGLRDQIGVLCDGTVVPCCLDHEGDIALGNLFNQSMDEILSSPRARALYDGFSNRKTTEALCRRCGYARRFG